MNATSLRGRRVAITGAGRGIGLATAKELHKRGAAVVIGDLDVKAATATAATVGPDVEAFALDVSDHSSFTAFIDKATANGPLDVLINNAGIMPIGHFLEQPIDVLQRAVQVNIMGCIHGMHLALPAMIERGSGHIINIASAAGKSPVPGGLTYCGTKSAVIALTETARVEFAGSGIEFTCIMPSFTNTELIAGTTATKLVPIAEPADVARAIADAVGRPKADVYVPKLVGTLLRPQPLLGRRLRDIVNRKLGAYNTFLDFDPDARAAYTRRITES